MKSQVKSLSNHERDRSERFMIRHTANVVIENYDASEKDFVVDDVSIKANYHPAGYGVYGISTIHPTGVENEYVVRWKTGDNCD